MGHPHSASPSAAVARPVGSRGDPVRARNAKRNAPSDDLVPAAARSVLRTRPRGSSAPPCPMAWRVVSISARAWISTR